ncbi:unnamed protein product [Peronospora belbahrii]|uniref:Uncharacterized protein n=1 Tax=Peronospora belbahrii TaxID=622444 RepID=A0AAU9LE16_9STRA|nr:unnamed protein product [Peronospora belbahrii]
MIKAFPASNNSVGAKKQLAEPEVIALNELLDTFPNEIDETKSEYGDNYKRTKIRASGSKTGVLYCPYRPKKSVENEEEDDMEEEKRREGAQEEQDRTFDTTERFVADSRGGAGGHRKLTDLVQRVRDLERDNLHLKQALLLRKKNTGRSMDAGNLNSLDNLGALSSLVGLRSIGARDTSGTLGVAEHTNVERLLAERTKVVTEMVEHLNATFLSLRDASRVWHEDCRISAGVREWDAFGRLQTISLWNMIRSVFKSIVVDVVELRPHLPDGEMMLTKWRIQGEIATARHLEQVCASEDCPATMRVALMAIKSPDLSFTVTTYVVFQDLRIAEQHHCWDQVGVFKRLFGGEIPPMVQNMLVIDEDTVSGRKQPLDV